MANEMVYDLPIKNKKRANQVKSDTEIRRDKIAEWAGKVGFWNLDKQILAKQFEVGLRQIYKDINHIKGHYKIENLREGKIELHIANKKALTSALLVLAETQGKDKMEAIKTTIQASQNYERFMESFKIKEKTPDKHEHNVTGYRVELVEESQTKNEPQTSPSNETP